MMSSSRARPRRGLPRKSTSSLWAGSTKKQIESSKRFARPGARPRSCVRKFAPTMVFCAAFASTQHQQPQPPNAVAHGSEKVAVETAHPEENAAGEHEGAKFLGLPSWLWKLVNMLAFFGVLGYFIGTPVKRAIATRREEVQREAEEARQRRAKADDMAAALPPPPPHPPHELLQLPTLTP